ncbi:MAG: methyltransferase [Deltaproteobacteria bacterium]|nr:methyltransferase [Deltaproteobacteria bacterium]
MLPFLEENAELFRGKRVLEIGTGSGIISVYAAVLGASKVVATDIDPNAIESLRRNAERFGKSDVVEGRLVPESDISAYSVIQPGEQFDIIVSNPPYSLDLDATENSPVIDTGDLGFSIVRGLDEHLAPGGTAMLFYASLFYHLTMVKYAEHEGWDVANHRPWMLFAWEVEPLFNTYLRRLLAREGVKADDMKFDNLEPHTIQHLRVDPMGREKRKPLLPGNSDKDYPGMMVLRRGAGGADAAKPTPAAEPAS